MKKAIILLTLFIATPILFSFSNKEETFALIIEVSDLRNSNGVVQFALYNNPDTFPDKHYKNYYRKRTAKILNGASKITFENLPVGKYAINILHDEDSNGKIKKGLIFPKEGIGFSNYQSIGISNKPAFHKASFELVADQTINVKIIYF